MKLKNQKARIEDSLLRPLVIHSLIPYPIVQPRFLLEKVVNVQIDKILVLIKEVVDA